MAPRPYRTTACYTVALCLTLFTLDIVAISAASQHCERLKSASTYTQEKAPRDVSVVLPIVVERVNEELDGVVDVEVEWSGGDLHGQVGEHIIQCKVTRLANSLAGQSVDTVSSMSDDVQAAEIYMDGEGRNVVTQCFHVPFSIIDTNECLLPSDHVMHHRCHDSTLCVNTIGSYECLCPRLGEQYEMDDDEEDAADEDFWVEIAKQNRGPWERSYDAASRSSCPGMVSTKDCCLDRVSRSKASDDASSCRAKFRCPRDPCSGSGRDSRNTCAETASCGRAVSPISYPDYECRCPDGLMGSGHACRPGDATPDPKVKFDGKTPTDLTIQNKLYCDCTAPVVDACDGFPPCQEKHQICTVSPGNQPSCACKLGYVLHEHYGCVDESPPELRLKNDPNGDRILRLKQGDVYKEHAVIIQDENAEEYLRSLKIAYSQPLPPGCLRKMGEFHVNYTVETPWTSPPYVRITRRVVVEDIDECLLDRDEFENSCPDLVPRCDTASGASCVNTLGSYKCQCPDFTMGDGFAKGLSFEPQNTPDGFQGGTSCRDTGIPVIKILGPNPKIFRVAECSGIHGESGGKAERDLSLKSSQQSHYGKDIKELIQVSGGAELCATHGATEATDCVMAYDETHKGRVDLSHLVTAGDPVKKSGLRWSVPYNVKDASGNSAVTVWRDVVVEEINLQGLERKVRDEVRQHHEMDVKRAVDAALDEDRKKRRDLVIAQSRESSGPETNCPACDCADRFSKAMCDAACAERIRHCAIDNESYAIWLLLLLERALPSTMVPVVLNISMLALSIMLLRLILSILVNPTPSRQAYYNDEERERALQQSVTYHRDGMMTTPRDAASMASPPPRASLSTGRENGGFSSNHQNGNIYPLFGSPNDSSNGVQAAPDYTDIYLSSPVTSTITPRKRGERGSQSPYMGNGRSSL